MGAQAVALSYNGDPQIVGGPTGDNATLIARPEALLKFEETQERQASPLFGGGNDAGRTTGAARAPPKKKGGILSFLFCGNNENGAVPWEDNSHLAEEAVNPKEKVRVPWNAELQCYILSCISHLERRGYSEQRLFAVSGSQEVIDGMRMNYGETLPEDTDVHVICAVLKQAIRDAESPLIDIEALKQWAMSTADKKSEKNQPEFAIPEFRSCHLYNTLKVVAKRSPRRAYVLAKFICLLADISARIEVTQMSSHNLALCLAPSLLQWDPYEDAALLILGRMTAFVMELIDNGRENAEKLKEHCLELQMLADLPTTPMTDVDEGERPE